MTNNLEIWGKHFNYRVWDELWKLVVNVDLYNSDIPITKKDRQCLNFHQVIDIWNQSWNLKKINFQVLTKYLNFLRNSFNKNVNESAKKQIGIFQFFRCYVTTQVYPMPMSLSGSHRSLSLGVTKIGWPERSSHFFLWVIRALLSPKLKVTAHTN